MVSEPRFPSLFSSSSTAPGVVFYNQTSEKSLKKALIYTYAHIPNHEIPSSSPEKYEATSSCIQGFLDEQFTQLQQIQDESNPDFVFEVVSLFFESNPDNEDVNVEILVEAENDEERFLKSLIENHDTLEVNNSLDIFQNSEDRVIQDIVEGLPGRTRRSSLILRSLSIFECGKD